MSNSSNDTAAKDSTQPSVSADSPAKRRAWDFTPADGPAKPGSCWDNIKSAHQARHQERLLQQCMAFCRSTSQPCRMKKVPGKNRCRLHGGLSTGPTTPEGRARIAESNRRRALGGISHAELMRRSKSVVAEIHRCLDAEMPMQQGLAEALPTLERLRAELERRQRLRELQPAA